MHEARYNAWTLNAREQIAPLTTCEKNNAHEEQDAAPLGAGRGHHLPVRSMLKPA